MLESGENNWEPSNSTSHSSISSTPLEPLEDHKRKEGAINEPSSSSTPERPVIPATHTHTMGELEGRLLKRIQAIEGQLTPYGTQEIPVRQKELETKPNRLLQTGDLPSFRLQVLTPVPKCAGRFLQNGGTEPFRANYCKIKHFVDFRV